MSRGGARPRVARRAALAAALTVAGLLPGSALAAGSAASASAATPQPIPCLGAASRDPLNRCVNPDLRLQVLPSPIDALLVPNSPCAFTGKASLLNPCHFGPADGEATEHIALIGDSHATHWRAALEYAARERNASGTSMTRSGCPLTAVAVLLPEPGKTQCKRWNDAVVKWLREHPDVHTVFVSQRSKIEVKVAEGESQFEKRMAGYLKAWERLPQSVTRIVVIRDSPNRPIRTLDCIDSAIAAKKPVGTACAIRRNNVLHLDAASVAARRLGSPRIRVIDLMKHFCSDRLCFPVVGGVLVQKDQSHMSVAFSETLGPYLLRRLDQLVQRIAPAPEPAPQGSAPAA